MIFPLFQFRTGGHNDVIRGSFRKSYVVQTNGKIIERCLLMTTDPGDIVLDPPVEVVLLPMLLSSGEDAGLPLIRAVSRLP